MKKTLIVLMALTSVASASNYFGGAEVNPFAEYAAKYTVGQDYALTFELGYVSPFNANNDGATILVLDDTNWSVFTQQARYVGMDEGLNGISSGFVNYTSRTEFNTSEQTDGWFIDYGSIGAINGITIKVEGMAATNTTVLTFPKGQGEVTMTIDRLLDFNDINIGRVMTASNITFETPSVPEPTTGALSLLALAGLCIRRRK